MEVNYYYFLVCIGPISMGGQQFSGKGKVWFVVCG